MRTIALNLGPATAWAATGGKVGTIDPDGAPGHPGRLAYAFSNAIADLLDRHVPTISR